MNKVYHVMARRLFSNTLETIGLINIPEHKAADARELVKALISEDADEPVELDMVVLLGEGIYVKRGRDTIQYTVVIRDVLEP